MPDGHVPRGGEWTPLLARALGVAAGDVVAALAGVARLRRIVAGEALGAGRAWLVLEGDVAGDASRRFVPGDLVGWPALFSRSRAPSVHAWDGATVLEFERESVREAIAGDFEMLLVAARPLAVAAALRLGAAVEEPHESVLDRVRALRVTPPFDELALDVVLELAAQRASGSRAQVTMIRALSGIEPLDAGDELVLDVLEDHPLAALAVLAWLGDSAEDAPGGRPGDVAAAD